MDCTMKRLLSSPHYRPPRLQMMEILDGSILASLGSSPTGMGR